MQLDALASRRVNCGGGTRVMRRSDGRTDTHTGTNGRMTLGVANASAVDAFDDDNDNDDDDDDDRAGGANVRTE